MREKINELIDKANELSALLVLGQKAIPFLEEIFIFINEIEPVLEEINQSISDNLKKMPSATNQISKVTEATALGGAMAAGVGAGVYKDITDAAKKLVIWDRVYEPNMENKKVYETIKIKFEEAYAVQLKLVDDSITTSMWRAPGHKV